MNLKIVLGVLSILLVISILAFYWLLISPRETIEFNLKPKSSNFSLNAYKENMQFYPNMRYPSSKISYKIEACPLQKASEMEEAFQEISNLTALEFYPASFDEEIIVTCDETTKKEGELFIAGEGGPTYTIAGDKFNVIFSGKILLLRDSQCDKPNVAIHELLHALGFAHSNNLKNIMFNITTCIQTVGEDTIELINELYSYPNYADLDITNVSAIINGRSLDTNITVRNNGLKDSESFNLEIYADNKLIKEMKIDGMKIGIGKILVFQNILISRTVTEQLRFVVSSNFQELEKENNEKILEVRK